MNPRLTKMPMMLLWGSTSLTGLKLLKWHLKLHGLMNADSARTLKVIGCLFLVALFSSFIYEIGRLLDFLLFGGDNE